MLVLLTGCGSGLGIQINTPVSNPPSGVVTPSAPITIPGFSIKINVPGPNPLVNTDGIEGKVPGTLIGIWHGIISPVTLVVSFMKPDVQMYEVHNDGSQYNLGFLVGVAIVFLVLGALAGSRR